MEHKIPENFKWIPITEIQKYFNYKSTQLAALLKEDLLVVAKVGKKKFVHLDSLERFLEHKAKS